jgi:hypothetical protein
VHLRTRQGKEIIIMLRSIGSVTFLALFMVGCGGGGSGGGGSLATYSIGGTVTVLTGFAAAITRLAKLREAID